MTFGSVVDAVAELAERQRAGGDDERLREELLTAVLPWVRQQVAANVRRIPSNADPSNVSSLMHEAAYLAVRRLDWERADQWPMYLGSLVRRAAQEAARRDDYLSRHQRVLRTRFRALCAAEEARTGGPIDDATRRQLATSVAEGRIDAAEFLLAGWHPCEVADVPDAVEDVESVEDEVERSVLRREVQVWLEQELPEETRAMVRVWLQTPRSQTLPRRLEHHLRPYIGKLLDAIDDRLAAEQAAS